MNVRALRYLRPMDLGWTLPHLLQCDDGQTYVVKFMNNPDGPGILANEWIAYRLARLVNLPVAPCRIVHIKRELIRMYPVLNNLRVPAGPHLGSLFAEDAVPLSEAVNLRACGNIRHAAGMIAFDHWINNWDRHLTDANLLYLPNERKLMMIDHSDAFFGPDWDLDAYRERPDDMEVFWGKLYELFVPFIDGPDPFGPSLAVIESISEEALLRVTRGLPKQWAIPEGDVMELVDFLLLRKDRVRETLQSLKKYFPIWAASDEG